MGQDPLDVCLSPQPRPGLLPAPPGSGSTSLGRQPGAFLLRAQTPQLSLLSCPGPPHQPLRVSQPGSCPTLPPPAPPRFSREALAPEDPRRQSLQLSGLSVCTGGQDGGGGVGAGHGLGALSVPGWAAPLEGRRDDRMGEHRARTRGGLGYSPLQPPCSPQAQEPGFSRSSVPGESESSGSALGEAPRGAPGAGGQGAAVPVSLGVCGQEPRGRPRPARWTELWLCHS